MAPLGSSVRSTSSRVRAFLGAFLCLAFASHGVALAAPPANDDCADATAVSALPFDDAIADTSEATTEPSDPTNGCDFQKGSNSVWYRFTAPSDGVVVADTFGSDYDTTLAAYTGACGAFTDELDCDEDSGGGSQSQISFPVTSGTTYLIEVTGNDASGSLAFSLAFAAPPANDACGAPVVIAAAPFTDSRDTIGATTAAGDPASTCGESQHSASVWYHFTSPASGSVTVDTFGSDYDTVLAVYSGSCAVPVEVACNDDDTEPPQSRIEFAATGGVAYLIAVTGFEGGGGGNLDFALAFSGGATPLPSATPTVSASATPLPTASPTATRTATPTVSATGGVATATATLTAAGGTPTPVLTPTATSTPVAAPTPDPAAAKAIEKCQKALVGAGRGFAGKTLKGLDGCANGVLKCIQTVADDGKRTACVAAARAKCTTAIDKIVAERAKLRAAVLAKCAAVPLDFVTGADGLGYGALAACDDTSSLAAVADCVVAESACALERVFAVAEPRAGELLRFAEIPPDRGAALACLPDFGGTGQDVDLEATSGKAIAKCETAIKKASSTVLRGELGALAKCAGKLLTCTLTKRGDAACPGKAAAACGKDLAKIEGLRAKVGPAIAKKCAAPLAGFAVLREPAAANLDALAGECAGAGVATLASLDDYAACVVRQHACRATTLLRAAMPRAISLIDAAAVVPPFAFPTVCPAP